jgi:hypothetical protein
MNELIITTIILFAFYLTADICDLKYQINKYGISYFKINLIFLLCIFTAIGWNLFFNYRIPLANYYKIFLVAIIFFIIYSFVFKKDKFNNYKRRIGKYKFSLLIFILVYIIYKLVAENVKFPIILTGNNDIFFYSKYSEIVLNQPIGNNVVGFDYYKTMAVDQTPLAFFLISLVSFLFNKPAYEIIGLPVILITSIVGYNIFIICNFLLKNNKFLNLLIAVIYITSSIYLYIVENYFLAQLISIAIFLYCYRYLIIRQGEFYQKILILSMAGYLQIMNYPTAFIPFNFLLFIPLLVKYIKFGDYKNYTPLLIMPISAFLSLIISIFLDYEHTLEMVKRIIYLSSVKGGWVLKLVNPLEFFMLPSFSPIDAGNIYFKVAIYLLIIICTTIAYVKAGTLRIKIVTASFLSSTLIYISYWLIIGDSYQQWKLATIILVPFIFLPILLVVKILIRYRVKFQYISILLMVIIFINILSICINLNSKKSLVEKIYQLSDISLYDRLGKYNKFIIDLKGDFEGTMIATQFINKLPLVILSKSYISKDMDFNKNMLDQKSLYLSNSCDLMDPSTLIWASKHYCIFDINSRISSNFTIPMNDKMPASIKVEGFSVAESWGRWTGALNSKISIPINSNNSDLTLLIEVQPYINKIGKSQRLNIYTKGQLLKSYDLNKQELLSLKVPEKFMIDNRLELDINTPDASSPSDYGFSDTRLLGVGFLNLNISR